MEITATLAKSIDEAFQLPGNTHVVNGKGVENHMSLLPAVSQLLEVILDLTFPPVCDAPETGVARSHLLSPQRHSSGFYA